MIKTVVSFIPVFLYTLLRVDCMDYHEYENMFNLIKHESEVNERFEIGYILLNKYSPSFFDVILIQNIIVYSAYIFVFYRFVPPKYSWIAFILFFLAADKTIFFMATAMRNAIAISLLLFSIPLIVKRKLLKFCILGFIAACFHTTSLVMFALAYLLGSRAEFKSSELNFWIISIIIILFASASYLVSVLGPMFETDTFSKYSTYIENVVDGGVAVKIISAIMSCLFLADLKQEKQLVALSLDRLALIFICFGFLGTLNARGPQYFVIPLILATITILNNCKNVWIKYGTSTTVIFYLGYGLFVVHLLNPFSSFITFKSELELYLL